MLTLENVDAGYGHVKALRDVSMEIQDGEMVGLFGANGAGKSTTLRTISGLIKPWGGTVSFDGRRIDGMAAEQTAALGIAHIPEGRGVFSRMTVWQNLKMGGWVRRMPRAKLDKAIDEVLEIFPQLRPRLNLPAGVMSGGEQQMLAIARALISKPRLLMLDEPSHGLAPKVVQEVFVLLARLRTEGVSLLVVEQYATVALSVVDRGYVLDRGSVAISGSAATLQRSWERLAGAYLGA